MCSSYAYYAHNYVILGVCFDTSLCCQMDGRGDQGGFVDGQVQRPPPGGRLGWPQAAPRMGGGMLNGVPNGPGTALLHAL